MLTNGKAAPVCDGTRPKAVENDDVRHLRIFRQIAQVAPPSLAYRRDCEKLTDESGAVLFRSLYWPRRRVFNCGAVLPEEIAMLRNLIDSGDEALVIGPLEGFVVMTTPRFFDLIVGGANG